MLKVLAALVIFIFGSPTLLLADGQTDYQINCTACHKGTARSNVRRAKLLKINPETLYLKDSKMTRDEMIAVTEKGKNKMPAFEKRLTKEQIIDIVDYIMSNKGVPQPEPSKSEKK